jgi:hypothetical protein
MKTTQVAEINSFEFITLDPKGGELWLIIPKSFERKMEGRTRSDAQIDVKN